MLAYRAQTSNLQLSGITQTIINLKVMVVQWYGYYKIIKVVTCHYSFRERNIMALDVVVVLFMLKEDTLCSQRDNNFQMLLTNPDQISFQFALIYLQKFRLIIFERL